MRKGRLIGVTGQTVVREDPTPKGIRRREEFHATVVPGANDCCQDGTEAALIADTERDHRQPRGAD